MAAPVWTIDNVMDLTAQAIQEENYELSMSRGRWLRSLGNDDLRTLRTRLRQEYTATSNLLRMGDIRVLINIIKHILLARGAERNQLTASAVNRYLANAPVVQPAAGFPAAQNLGPHISHHILSFLTPGVTLHPRDHLPMPQGTALLEALSSARFPGAEPPSKRQR